MPDNPNQKALSEPYRVNIDPLPLPLKEQLSRFWRDNVRLKYWFHHISTSQITQITQVSIDVIKRSWKEGRRSLKKKKCCDSPPSTKATTCCVTATESCGSATPENTSDRCGTSLIRRRQDQTRLRGFHISQRKFRKQQHSAAVGTGQGVGGVARRRGSSRKTTGTIVGISERTTKRLRGHSSRPTSRRKRNKGNFLQ